MALTWNDFTTLSAGQRAKLEEFRQLGLALRGVGSADIGALTDSQAKAAAQWLNQELLALEQPTEAGVRYVREFYRAQAAKAYEDSVT